MDYGSLYGMGSYYGQDYTAWTDAPGTVAEDGIAKSSCGKPHGAVARAAGSGSQRDEEHFSGLT